MPSTVNAINVLIVDDEPEACKNLENILQEYVGRSVNVVGTANSTRQAELLIRQLGPDAVFLDIEMPNENAFHFLDRVKPMLSFEVVFVTAYDDYAIRAFKLNAVDYILKPISIPELANAVQRLKEKIDIRKLLGNPAASYIGLSEQVNGRVKSQRITLRDNNNIEVVDFRDIYFVEAQGSYIRIIFVKNNETRDIVMSGSVTEYEELLPSETFFRIHKTYLVNCIHIKRITHDDSNFVVVEGNYTLPVSRRRYGPLIGFLQKNDLFNE